MEVAVADRSNPNRRTTLPPTFAPTDLLSRGGPSPACRRHRGETATILRAELLCRGSIIGASALGQFKEGASAFQSKASGEDDEPGSRDGDPTRLAISIRTDGRQTIRLHHSDKYSTRQREFHLEVDYLLASSLSCWTLVASRGGCQLSTSSISLPGWKGDCFNCQT
jgi:hypothetical protein